MQRFRLHADLLCKFVKAWNNSVMNQHLKIIMQNNAPVKTNKSWIMEPSIRASGTLRVAKMVRVFKSGLMDLSTKDTG